MQTNPKSPQPRSSSKLPLQIAAGLLIVLIYVGVVWYQKRHQDVVTIANDASIANTQDNLTTNNNSTTNTGNSTNSNNTSTNTSAYKNGSYSATGSYLSPAGQEQIGVQLTLTDGKITAVTVQPKTSDRESLQYQNEFVKSYKQFVIGKDISTLKLSKVAGSSLTPRGFNDALTQIKAKAAI